jgi:hypothetical protein
LAGGIPAIKQQNVTVSVAPAGELLLGLVERLRQILPVRFRFGIIHPVGEQMNEGLFGAQTITVRPAPERIGEIRRNCHRAEHG